MIQISSQKEKILKRKIIDFALQFELAITAREGKTIGTSLLCPPTTILGLHRRKHASEKQ
ncbi:hypothetical protein Mapa_006719 [Marchantia paleacea]|nr:hypothetical protein Mapa_006719 [Marchantia paleacea]